MTQRRLRQVHLDFHTSRDITGADLPERPLHSPWSQARLREAGVDLSDADAVHAQASEDLLAFMARVRSTVQDVAPGASTFFNGSVSARVRRTLQMQTHLEVESLPTSGADRVGAGLRLRLPRAGEPRRAGSRRARRRLPATGAARSDLAALHQPLARPRGRQPGGAHRRGHRRPGVPGRAPDGAYPRHEYWVYRVLAEELLDGLLGERLLRLDGPAWIEATCSRQDSARGAGPGRSVVHLTAYQARRSALPVPRVDEAGAIAGVTLSLRLAAPATDVYLAPDRIPVEHETVGGSLVVRLPPLGTHTVVVVEHGS